MDFNRHFNLPAPHAFLSASNYHWLNDDEEKLRRRFSSAQAARRGTEMHKLAHDLIRLRVKLPTRPPTTMGLYVNDGIKYAMTPEQPLVYSDNAFGTADTIGFHKNMLRVHDLKNGITRTSPVQLEVYAAYFCLEYGMSPFDIEIELRIYQNNEIRVYEPSPERIRQVMDKAISDDELVDAWKKEA